jgi:hypothetical protein
MVVVWTGSCLSSPLPSEDSDSLVLRPSLPRLLRILPSLAVTLAKLSVCDASAFNWLPSNSAVSTESHLKRPRTKDEALRCLDYFKRQSQATRMREMFDFISFFTCFPASLKALLKFYRAMGKIFSARSSLFLHASAFPAEKESSFRSSVRLTRFIAEYNCNSL